MISVDKRKVKIDGELYQVVVELTILVYGILDAYPEPKDTKKLADEIRKYVDAGISIYEKGKQQ